MFGHRPELVLFHAQQRTAWAHARQAGSANPMAAARAGRVGGGWVCGTRQMGFDERGFAMTCQKAQESQKRPATKGFREMNGKSIPQQGGLPPEVETYAQRIPTAYRKNYLRAMLGKSKAAALKAKCQDCTNWQREEITHCPVMTCPCWPYRPYAHDKK